MAHLLRSWIGRWAFLAAAVVGMAAEPTVSFTGYLFVGGKYQFSLYATARNQTSEWLAVGSEFEGYTIESFDPKSEMLTVRWHDAQAVVLSIRPAREVLDVRPAAVAQEPVRVARMVVMTDGRFLLDNVACDFDGLKRQMTQRRTDTVRIQVAPKTSMETVKTVMKTLQEAGVTRFSIAAEASDVSGSR